MAKIRSSKNISARDLSLSNGQSHSYINNIENQRTLPSMETFLYICEYLKISPKDFFDDEIDSPIEFQKAVEALKPLKNNNLI